MVVEEGTTAPSSGKQKNGLAPTKKIQSRSAKCGLDFPVARVAKRLRRYSGHKGRLGSTASVYMTAVLENFAADLIQSAGEACKQLKAKRIKPCHIADAISLDTEMYHFCGTNLTIEECGATARDRAVVKGRLLARKKKEAYEKELRAQARSEKADQRNLANVENMKQKAIVREAGLKKENKKDNKPEKKEKDKDKSEKNVSDDADKHSGKHKRKSSSSHKSSSSSGDKADKKKRSEK
tara:strand:- start:523 stop:1236 length:714 start_codon:yes stop_codon:yes gene_type:complete